MSKLKSSLAKLPLNRYFDVIILIFLAIFPLMTEVFRVEMMGRYICYAIFALRSEERR